VRATCYKERVRFVSGSGMLGWLVGAFFLSSCGPPEDGERGASASVRDGSADARAEPAVERVVAVGKGRRFAEVCAAAGGCEPPPGWSTTAECPVENVWIVDDEPR
jgi:hypothetical protein